MWSWVISGALDNGHCRRKFVEVIKSHQPCGRRWGKHRKKGLAEEALAQIQKLYAVEKAARDFTPADRHRYRQEHARPLWAAIGLDLPSIIFGALLLVCYHHKESRDD